jgi:hypothetical protein
MGKGAVTSSRNGAGYKKKITILIDLSSLSTIQQNCLEPIYTNRNNCQIATDAFEDVR